MKFKKETKEAFCKKENYYGLALKENASSLTKGMSGIHIEDAGMPNRWS